MTRSSPGPARLWLRLCWSCCCLLAAVEGRLFTAKLWSVRAGLGGFEPGDAAPAFSVSTLDGEFSYPPKDSSSSSSSSSLRPALIIHAFTNKSAFLEVLWTSNMSLSDLAEFLPPSAQVLFISMDDSAAEQALWMREQVYGAAGSRWKEIRSRLHFSPVPLHMLGNWIPRVFYSWGCGGHNCGLAQVVFTSSEWSVPVISKRLNARYDWLNGRWDPKPYVLAEAGDGCKPVPEVAGVVAWVSEGGCSFFTKIKTMSESNATGVLVYASPGNPIQDMNCVGDECNTTLNIPAAMLHIEPAVVEALSKGKSVNVSFQVTPSPNFFFAIDHQGALAEMGWFLYPTFRFLSWQAEWFDFYTGLLEQAKKPADVVPVFDRVLMQGEAGAQAVVDLPPDLLRYDVLELDAALSCPGLRDETCAHWDHTVQLFVCCDRFSPHCNQELGRWITAFRRGTGRWLTDVSPLLALLNGERCSLTMKTVPWAMPWMTSLNLRFSYSNSSGNSSENLYPFKLVSLYNGGTFDRDYNKRFQEIKFDIPASAKKVELYAVITGHGSDDNACCEFCVTSHFFSVNGIYNNSRIFDSAGSALGCALRVGEGGVPNEHGTWLYGRGGWCDGLQVNPWRIDITPQVNMGGTNTILYFGLFDGRNPNPARDPGYIIMYSYLIFYK
uniref:Si:dkey-256h2.1 n=1 Tax=Astyanax mexicanus TaxID=7994 RepID=W5LR72_ASTMX